MFLPVIVDAANPSYTDFNANQFGTTAYKVVIKPGSITTNGIDYGRTNYGDAFISGSLSVSNVYYSTNSVTTGNATITWDASKSFQMVSTNVAVTLQIANIPTSDAVISELVLSNSGANTTFDLLSWPAGLIVWTNGYPCAGGVYFTNLTGKAQTLSLVGRFYAGVLSNAVAKHSYAP